METKLEKDWYSIVVYPQKGIINKVKIMKDELADRIGNYKSRNSEAHITIIEFEADLNEFLFYKYYIKNFCLYQKPEHISFDEIVLSKQSKALVLLPAVASKIYLRDLLKNFRKGLKHLNVTNGSVAHISIGRALYPNQIEGANNIFNNINLDFNCEKIAIRKFNTSIGQFEVIYEFFFQGESPVEGQLSLFQ
ncbi:hypothetical protein [Pedobacter agri]|uniref:hypothetical protein n=1 Tax=Pedobacter agri TaxID=454586 RepID=UPI0027898BAB|nr:hypothetical protein [Pedobacter agri]MDQ1142580.1 hypothetical protein [Pedobacter agri]